MTRQTISDAMGRANEAMNRIETHEEVCAVRYETIAAGQRAQQAALAEFKDDVTKTLNDQRVDNKWMLRWIIATLLTAVAGLAGAVFVLMTHAS